MSTSCQPNWRARLQAAGLILLIALAMPATALATAGLQTRFDYVAVFPVSSDPAAIEAWRQQVLGRIHGRGCLRDLPCVARMMRLALPSQGGREVIGFDLMPDISPDERAAIVAAATRVIAGTRLMPDQRPSDLPTPLPPEIQPTRNP